jgi:Co/Zn/Cd efflux system component
MGFSGTTGVWFGSVALIADGLHMSTHAGALLIAALAYTYAAFTSAIALAMIALLICYARS